MYVSCQLYSRIEVRSDVKYCIRWDAAEEFRGLASLQTRNVGCISRKCWSD